MDITLEEYKDIIYKKMLELIKISTYDYYNDLVAGYRRVIDEFYDSYIPHLYHRSGSLYDACKIEINQKGVVDVSVDASYMEKEHRVSNDYIYNVVFVKGWHGGAVPGGDQSRFKGKFTPDIGGDVPSKLTPHYRDYPWSFEYWSEEAERTESPYKMWMKEYKRITNEMVRKHKALAKEVIALLKQGKKSISA